MKQTLITILFTMSLIIPVYAKAQNGTEQLYSFEQLFMDMLIESTIIAFDNPDTRKELSKLSEMIKDEQTFQAVLHRIDKFIAAHELEGYREQAEELKAFITESRRQYIESEKAAIEKYQQLKEQQQQRERQRQLRDANVIEV